MGGSKQNFTSTECLAPRKSLSVDASASHGQQSAQSAKGNLAHNPDMTDAAILDNIFAEYEE
jgi:hypothetical protein